MLFDELDPRSPVPLYAQIAERVRLGIVTGALEAGDSLPSVRRLSRELRVNPATVVQAYRELEQVSLVTTRRGAGTFVCDLSAHQKKKERLMIARRLVRALVDQAAQNGIEPAQLNEALRLELGAAAREQKDTLALAGVGKGSEDHG